MPVIVNGEPVALAGPSATLEGLLASLTPQKPFAVACNQEFVPASAYAQCELKDGDRIDIVHPSAGG
jgi:sulfur carrier protein